VKDSDQAASAGQREDSVHLKSNRGDLKNDIAKREEASRQLLAHSSEMERLYSNASKVITVIAGDFNTNPTDPRPPQNKPWV
jgi:hypothetical protein